jgi:hypothetical protein
MNPPRRDQRRKYAARVLVEVDSFARQNVRLSCPNAEDVKLLLRAKSEVLLPLAAARGRGM